MGRSAWAWRPVSDRIQKLIVTNTAAFRSQKFRCRLQVVGSSFSDRYCLGFNLLLVLPHGVHLQWVGSLVKRGLVFPYDSWQVNRHPSICRRHSTQKSHPSYQALCEVEQGLEQFKNHPMILFGGDDFCFTPNFRKEWMGVSQI